jgi:hypothetical protein
MADCEEGDCDDTFFRDVALCNYYREAKFFLRS